MKSQITFITDVFESKEVKSHSVNDRCFGEDVAGWLVEKTKDGEFDFGEPFQEDSGWAVPVEVGGEKFVVRIRIMDESIGADQADWLIAVEKVRKWKMFSSKDSPQRGELCDLIQNVLRDAAHIREIRWID